MNNYLRKNFMILLAAAAMILAVAGTAFAATTEYRISYADWEENANGLTGKVTATWDREKGTPYHIYLYYASDENKTPTLIKPYSTKGKADKGNIPSYVEAHGTSYDFSKILVNLGKSSGYYGFRVIPVINGVENRDDSAYSDGTLEINKTVMTNMKNYVNGIKALEYQNTPVGWDLGPGGWRYHKGEGKYARNEWIKDGNYWYYIGNDYSMLKGWNLIKGLWYYLAPNGSYGIPEGAMFANTTTPDGYYVNADGVYVDYSVPTNNGVNRELTQITFSLKKTNAAPGGYDTVETLTAANVQFRNITQTPAVSSYSPGVTVTLRAEMVPAAGYRFPVSIQYKCSSAERISVTGTDPMLRYVEIQYRPKYLLEVPNGVYISNDSVLKWNKVKYANAYKVKMVPAGVDSKSRTVTVNSPEISVESYFDDEDLNELGVYITATHTGNQKSYYTDSAAYSIGNYEDFVRTGTPYGEFKKSGSSLRYINEDGEKATGWQMIGGVWYLFDEKGYAKGPGWVQDTYWYYFDKNHGMVIGTVTDNGKQYFLNDGSVAGLPVGAWVEGR